MSNYLEIVAFQMILLHLLYTTIVYIINQYSKIEDWGYGCFKIQIFLHRNKLYFKMC